MPRKKRTVQQDLANNGAQIPSAEQLAVGIEVENTTFFKQCVTFVTPSGHKTITLKPGEKTVVKDVGRDSIIYYISNNILKVNANASL